MPIFYPYRALGYITDATPLSVQRRGRETFVTVSVGKAWQIYNCAKLSLVFVGPQLEKSIRALASWRDFTFAAYGRHIGVFNRAHQVATWSAHTGKVTLLLPFGDHIISVGQDRRMLIWAVEGNPAAAAAAGGAAPAGEVQLAEGFTPTCIMHPDTYLNKVLLGSEEGRLQLWNVSSGKLVYEFPGWGSPVRCCVASPALDTVAVGCADGKVHVHNLKFDETLVSFAHTTKGPVTALSFRTDGQPLLAAGGAAGVVSIWHLEKRKLQAVVKDAHDGAIVSLHFFPREPVLLSSGADNSLKMWIFDSDDGEARLLRFRSGHSAPPACIRYYGKGRHILSAGQDRAFRLFSTIQDQQSRELSQGHVAKRAKKLKLQEEELKLARVVAFAAAEIRERDWCNVVTCHEGDTSAYTWRLQNFVIGDHILQPLGGDPTPVKACAISACGHFGILGTAGGRIERFNLQSGQPRGSFQSRKQQYAGAHEGAIVGLECDSTNTHLFSGGYDGLIKVWDFRTGQLKATLSVGSPLTKMAYHRGNGLLVAASDDLALRVYDAVAGRLVRKFAGHADRVTDVHVSEDGRWLLTAGMDRTIRTWDLVAARQLDCLRCEVAATGLSLSPGMDMLATVHVNRRGIYLWANKMMYSGLDDADILGSGQTVRAIAMPSVSTGLADAQEEGAEGEEGRPDRPEAATSAQAEAAADVAAAKEGVPGGAQLMPELITLAMLPRTQWQNLVNLDIIKERNKPIAPPKKAEQAPFFLPTLPTFSGETVFAPPTPGQDEGPSANGDAPGGASRVKRRTGSEAFRSEFSRLLHEGAESGDYSPLVAMLTGLSPSAIDLELRTLEIVEDPAEAPEEDVREVEALLQFLAAETSANRSFELMQAVTHRALTIHGDAITKHPRLQEKAKGLLEQQSQAWQRLDGLFQSVRCMVGFQSNTQ